MARREKATNVDKQLRYHLFENLFQRGTPRLRRVTFQVPDTVRAEIGTIFMQKITDNEIQFFNENGYLILKGVIQPDELAVTQSESQRLIDEILAGGPADEWCNRGPEGIPYYLTYLHSHPNEFSLRLLGHPSVGDLLHRIIGPRFYSLL